MNENNKISDIIKTSLENIRTVVDANTIIGDPIVTPAGVTILPVSKLSVGFASGGFDYLGKNSSQSSKDKGNNFGGGGGSGLTVEPVAFLVINTEGDVKLLPISVPAAQKSDIAAIIDGAPTLIDKIKSFFPKKSEPESEVTAEAEASAVTAEETAAEATAEATAE